MYERDLIILGAGPGGYVAAIRAAQLGLNTVLVEKEKPGGVCLNIGCIPSKALIRQAEIFSEIPHLEILGVKVDTKKFEYRKVFEKSRKAADQLSSGVSFLLKKNGIEVIKGRGRLKDGHSVELDNGTVITGRNILLATGSRPRELPEFPFDEKQILSSTGFLMQDSLPSSLIVLGSGAIGMEAAYIMNGFGVDVTVIEMLDDILPLEDREAASVLERVLKKRGIRFYSGTRAESMIKTESTVTLKVRDKTGKTLDIKADKLLVAAGRVANTEHLGLEAAGVETLKNGVKTGDYYQTSVPSVYAVGDLTDTPQLAHVASREGEIAVEHMAGHSGAFKRVDPLLVPSATYTEPQIAHFGYNEKQAGEKGLDFEVRSFPFKAVGKAVATEKTEGFSKVLVLKESGEIIGCHIVGSQATEILHEYLLAAGSELLAEDVSRMIHAHPTISEALLENALMFGPGAVHV